MNFLHIIIKMLLEIFWKIQSVNKDLPLVSNIIQSIHEINIVFQKRNHGQIWKHAWVKSIGSRSSSSWKCSCAISWSLDMRSFSSQRLSGRLASIPNSTTKPTGPKLIECTQILKLDFEKYKAAAAAAARRPYRGLTWLGRARRAGGAPAYD